MNNQGVQIRFTSMREIFAELVATEPKDDFVVECLNSVYMHLHCLLNNSPTWHLWKPPRDAFKTRNRFIYFLYPSAFQE